MEMTEEQLSDIKEQSYLRGKRAAYLEQIQSALRDLGYDAELFTKEYLIKEREEVIAALRSACDEFGDNDWDENLHLADIINKHLIRYIE